MELLQGPSQNLAGQGSQAALAAGLGRAGVESEGPGAKSFLVNAEKGLQWESTVRSGTASHSHHPPFAFWQAFKHSQ
jgi:hypothetical protein